MEATRWKATCAAQPEVLRWPIVAVHWRRDIATELQELWVTRWPPPGARIFPLSQCIGSFIPSLVSERKSSRMMFLKKQLGTVIDFVVEV